MIILSYEELARKLTEVFSADRIEEARSLFHKLYGDGKSYDFGDFALRLITGHITKEADVKKWHDNVLGIPWPLRHAYQSVVRENLVNHEPPVPMKFYISGGSSFDLGITYRDQPATIYIRLVCYDKT